MSRPNSFSLARALAEALKTASPEARAALRDQITAYEVAYPATVRGFPVLLANLWEGLKSGTAP